MIPQISGGNASQIEFTRFPSFTYRMIEIDAYSQISGDIDDLDSIRQAVFHVLMTERYDYVIYSDDYGIELRKYFGRGFDFLQASIQNTLRDGLLQDDRITDVTVTKVTRSSIDRAHVEFTVTSDRGTFNVEVPVSV